MTKRMSLLVVLFLFVFGTSVAAAKNYKVIDNYNQEIPMGTGSFKFENLKVYVDPNNYGGADVSVFGSVINNTDKNWKEIKFNIQYLDSNGTTIYIEDLNTYRFMSHTTQTIGYEKNDYLRTDYKSTYDIYGHDYVSNNQLKNVSQIKIIISDLELSGKANVKLIEPNSSSELKYDDDYINLAFSIPQGEHSIGISLKNKTSAPIKIDWNQVSFVSMSGKATKVIHEGIKLNNSGEMQAPTLIPPRAILSDVIAPTSHFYYSDGWQYISILPSGQSALSSVGKEFSVFLPLEVDGQIKNYNFVFKIDSAENI